MNNVNFDADDQSTTEMPTLEQLIEQYFDSLHSVTWGTTFTITDKKTRAQAVKFLTDTIREVIHSENGIQQEAVSNGH